MRDIVELVLVPDLGGRQTEQVMMSLTMLSLFVAHF